MKNFFIKYFNEIKNIDIKYFCVEHANKIKIFEAIITFIFATFVNAYVISVLWGWFVAPTFNLPLLSLPVAYMLHVFVLYLTHVPNLTEAPFLFLKVKEEVEENPYFIYTIEHIKCAYMILKPLGALLAGWIVKEFIM